MYFGITPNDFIFISKLFTGTDDVMVIRLRIGQTAVNKHQLGLDLGKSMDLAF